MASSGDLDYPQAPFSQVLTPEEMVKEYGSGVVLASGLIVDGLKAFGDDLWVACDYGMGKKSVIFNKQTVLNVISENITEDEIIRFNYNIEGAIVTDINAVIANSHNQQKEKIDWIRRFNKFAGSYLDGDLKKTSYCLKHVSLWHSWCKLRNEMEEIDWSKVDFSKDYIANVSDNVATACAGGSCDI